MGVTSIEWTGTVLDNGEAVPGYTWNPWRGCTKISNGCSHCYAETLSARNPSVLGEWGPQGKRVVGSEDNWAKPLLWNRRAAATGMRPKVFSLSLGDWLEDFPGNVVDVKGNRLFRRVDVNASAIDGSVGCTLDDARARMLDTIRRTDRLTYLLLTKRPENWRRLLWSARGLVARHCRERDALVAWIDDWLAGKAPRNVWLGVSCEDQEAADGRIPALNQIPARIRFISFEPLLGPIETLPDPHNLYGCIHWAIIGGESGHGARPCNAYWIRGLARQCDDASVATFVKQWGSRPFLDPTGGSRYDDHTYHKLGHPKGGDPAEWPEWMRIREFPRVAEHAS